MTATQDLENVTRDSGDSYDENRQAESQTQHAKPSELHQLDGEAAATEANGSSQEQHYVPAATYYRDPHAIIGETDKRELFRIASDLTTRRKSTTDTSTNVGSTLAETDEQDPSLNPEDPKFDLAKWLRHFFQQAYEDGFTIKKTGVSFRELYISGSGSAVQVQQTVGSYLAMPFSPGEFFSLGHRKHKEILHGFDGCLQSGELLVVLGRPGSGCSTLLKAICGELHGLLTGPSTKIHYNGIPQKLMLKEFKGEAIYNQEVDKHFPHLTVGQTLEFAATVRTPSKGNHGMSHRDMCKYIAKVVMAACGLSHTYNTKVGNDFIRGVSGGERKRVSIAEMVLAGSPLGAWDNSTRGLDSATALEFIKALRMASDIGGQANAVAIYQASQAVYDLFDKATVLYQGRQIYFGPASQAKQYFENQGWQCPPRQTTGDFLTSVTNPQERVARPGMENKVPRTPKEFESYWRQSPEYGQLMKELDEYDSQHCGPQQENTLALMRSQKRRLQHKHARPGSSYILSPGRQVVDLVRRAYQRILGDIYATAAQVIVTVFLALIIGSIFYGTPEDTSSFYARGSVLFMAILISALTAITEINSLYSQRPIVEKHSSFAFYHPAAEAAAGIIADVPIKFMTATAFNLILYFMAGLQRTASQFFIYFLVTFTSTFVMSGVFRTIAATTRTVSQAMAVSGVIALALVIYTGFAITVPDMHPWFSWIRWVNPIYYAFEMLIANEFHSTNFTCASIIPPYSSPIGDSWICGVPGAIAGQLTVSGDAFIAANYEYYHSHMWRNYGILIAFLVFFMAVYFIAVELNSNTSSAAESLMFQRGRVPAYLKDGYVPTEGVVGESKEQERPIALAPQKDIFTWRDLVYEIEIKENPRRLLDNVSGWVKPGTLTALMGVSGAGKTTLLDVLAQRTSIGVITGDMLVNGGPLDSSFQRKTGYVQQQDLHLETSTVRESLRFSALLRQPASSSLEQKYAFVEEVIRMLNMGEFADAVVGVPGEGLNVEQRKLLSIGVELAAKPKLLLFLDEPTSGLDSQSSWAICTLLRKLADSGQAILCTVHQPSAILFQAFDRLLFLAKGGRTVYFGDIGVNSRTLLDYFEDKGARTCGDDENPAEYMLEVVNHGTNEVGEDWHSIWKESAELQAVNTELERIHATGENQFYDATSDAGSDTSADAEFAMPLSSQIAAVTERVFQQYWRMPSYVFAKFSLGICAGLFIGFTFYNASMSLSGMQNVMYSVFMVTTIFSILVQQIQPLFITQRSLYEVRERPSKAYSWKAFMLANILVEIPYQILTGILVYACFYYPVIGIQNSARQGLVLLFVVQLFIYASAFAQMTIAVMPDAHTASSLVNILTIMSVTFNGVLQPPDSLPKFWIFMYRVSPFTYWIAGIVSTELHERQVECSERETSVFNPPNGTSCEQYLQPMLAHGAPGTLQNPQAMENCRYCPISVADQYLALAKIEWDERWRNYGILWVYVALNIFMALFLYYVFRVKKSRSRSS